MHTYMTKTGRKQKQKKPQDINPGVGFLDA